MLREAGLRVSILIDRLADMYWERPLWARCRLSAAASAARSVPPASVRRSKRLRSSRLVGNNPEPPAAGIRNLPFSGNFGIRCNRLSPPLKQPVHIHLSFCADIHMPVYDGGYVEAESITGTVTGGILIAVVELMSDVRGIACMQHCSPVR